MRKSLELARRISHERHFVPEEVFRPRTLSRENLAAACGIDYEAIRGKAVIGSFQRDTLGADLTTPKWQKGPDVLVAIVSRLPRNQSWVLLLAGPRRHYIVKECQRLGLPYVFCGAEPRSGIDDYPAAILPSTVVSQLYQLTDLYLVTSNSEGGPKAILECAFTATPVLSTRVGLAPDFLPDSCLFDTIDEAADRARMLLGNAHSSQDALWSHTREKALSIAGAASIVDRWRDIYTQL